MQEQGARKAASTQFRPPIQLPTCYITAHYAATYQDIESDKLQPIGPTVLQRVRQCNSKQQLHTQWLLACTRAATDVYKP